MLKTGKTRFGKKLKQDVKFPKILRKSQKKIQKLTKLRNNMFLN